MTPSPVARFCRLVLLGTLLTLGQRAADASAGPAEPAFDALVAAEEPALGPSPVPLMGSRDLDDLIGPGDPSAATRAVVDVSGQPFTKAVRIEVREKTDPVWKVTLRSATNAAPIADGDTVFGVFWIRAEAPNESATGHFNAWLEETGTYASWFNFAGTPGRTWSKRYFACVAPRDLEAGRLNLVLHLGGQAQAVEVAGMQVWSLGPDVAVESLPKSRVGYAGQEADAPWRAEAQRRIEAFRKGPLRVRLVRGGSPLPGARVDFELARHAFGFGTFVEGSNSPVLWDNPDGERFRELVTSTFNRVTCPIYPAEAWGWPNPQVRRNYLKLLEWADEGGFDTRAHVLIWSGWDNLPEAWERAKDDPGELGPLVDAYVEEVLTALKPFGLTDLDVMNEPRVHHVLEDSLGGESIRADWFAAADRILPGVNLAINEYGIVSDRGTNAGNHAAYEQAIRGLLEAGAPLEVIGIQGHIGEDFTTPEQMWRVFDRFAAFGLPLQITEFDVDTGDEETQADYVRDFLTAAFAHEAVEAVTLWGFWAGQQWKPEAALWNEDWTPKPAGEALVELLTRAWATRETAATGGDGVAEVRGFYGTYQVEVELDGERRVFDVEHGRGGGVVELAWD